MPYRTTITYTIEATDPGDTVSLVEIKGEVIVELDTVDHVHEVSQHVHKAMRNIQSNWPAPKATAATS